MTYDNVHMPVPQLKQLDAACISVLSVETSGSKELTCVAHTERVNIYCDGCFDFLNVAAWFSGSADPFADDPATPNDMMSFIPCHYHVQ